LLPEAVERDVGANLAAKRPADPVAFGLTTSLARPDQNFTGVVIDAGVEMWGKL